MEEPPNISLFVVVGRGFTPAAILTKKLFSAAASRRPTKTFLF
jgi:hypothetical protein